MTDYAKSAVNLSNPPQVKELYTKYKNEEAQIKVLDEQIQALIPQELRDRLEIANKWHAETNAAIRKSIDEFGSYQDLEADVYAIKQRKVSKSYDAERFDYSYSEYSKAVIVKAIDTTKLSGLIKGGLIKEDELKTKGILKETESFAYIIK